MTCKHHAEQSMPIELTVEQALNAAFALGQTYWQQADSDFTSHHRKADVTSAKFRELRNNTVASVAAWSKS